MQVRGSANPVAGPYYNFSVSEATGVAAVLAPQDSSLLGFVSVVAPAVVSGNTVIAVASESRPLPADSDGWQLFGVSCTSARFCEAVGGYFDEDNDTNDTVAASWNGTSWSLQSTVNPDPNGSAWTVQSVPGPSTTLGSDLIRVSWPSATSCTGVGSLTSNTVGSSYGQPETVVDDWNGTALLGARLALAPSGITAALTWSRPAATGRGRGGSGPFLAG